jgi:DNA mismatch endonuclease (patch repair protein)
MSRVRGKDTNPEMAVRRLVYGLGYRYRLNGCGLPGRPDLVVARARVAIFVHGCFWHRHHCANGQRMPKSRVAFWRSKLEGNAGRDRRNIQKLKSLGWRPLVVWECEICDLRRLADRIVHAIGPRFHATIKV